MELKPYIHIVNYYECDRMGITHHSNYIRFMEEARVNLMDQMGYGFERMEEDGVVSPVVAVECCYKKSTTFKDKIEVEVRLTDQSALKFSFSYVMRVNGQIVFTGSSTHCLMENGRPVKIKERYPMLFGEQQSFQ